MEQEREVGSWVASIQSIGRFFGTAKRSVKFGIDTLAVRGTSLIRGRRLPSPRDL